MSKIKGFFCVKICTKKFSENYKLRHKNAKKTRFQTKSVKLRSEKSPKSGNFRNMSFSELCFESSRKRENIDNNIKCIASQHEEEGKREIAPEVD